MVPETKEVLQKQKMGACQRDTEVNLKELPMAKAGIIWAMK